MTSWSCSLLGESDHPAYIRDGVSSMTLFGCDLSHHNAPGLSALRIPGFIIHKASQGVKFRDSRFAERNRYLMNVSTVVRGAYHFLESQRLQVYGTNKREDRGSQHSGAKQAEFFIKVVKAANGGTLDGMLMAIDIERLNFTSIKRRSMPEWQDVKGFIDRFRELTNQPLFIYTTKSWWTRFGNPSLRQWKDVYPWLAAWTCWNRIGIGNTDCGAVNRSSMPKANVQPSWWDDIAFGGRPALIRQWTNNARLNGRRVDCCATPLTLSELRRYTNAQLAPGDGGSDLPSGGDDDDAGTPTSPDGSVWDEAWLDEQGQPNEEAIALGSLGTTGIIVAGGMILLVGALFIGLTMANRRESVFDWQREAMGA